MDVPPVDLSSASAAFQDVIAFCKTPAEVGLALREVIAPHQFNASACGCFITSKAGPATHFYFQDWPADWIEIYQKGNFVAHDFQVAEARTRTLPFLWSEAKAARVLTRQEERVWQACLDYGWREGISVPIHGPAGYFGLVVLAGAQADYTPSLRQFLFLICIIAHARCQELSQAKIAPVRPGVLTARELECMRWVAAGLSDQEISRVLSLSINTTRGYVEDARRKLQARNRAHAVTIAFSLGLL